MNRVWCCLVAVALAGCNDTPPAPGSLDGQVRFTGELPPARVLQVYRDQEHCGHRDGERIQDVVVDAAGGLADVIVEVHGVPEPEAEFAEGGAEAVAPPRLRILQKGCKFEPHLLVVPDGSVVTIHNGDALVHKVNCDAWQHEQPPGSDLEVQFPATRRGFLRVNCNLHSWMEMWVYVPRSRWWARSGADGRFRIAGLPPGTYRATAAHPQLGRQRFDFTVKPGAATAHDLHFK